MGPRRRRFLAQPQPLYGSGRPTLSRISPATQYGGPVGDAWLRDNLIAIAQLAESLDRDSLELAFQVVPLDWWASRLPDGPSTL